MLKRILHITLFVCLCISSQAQHEAITSQYMSNGLVINPAYAGSRDAFSASLSYRKQWTGIEGAPTTLNFSMHSPLKDDRSSVSLMFYRDVIGVVEDNAIFGGYAYRMPLGKGKLSFGLSGGVRFLRADWAAIQTDQQGDLAFQQSSPLYILPDFSTGIYYYSEQFFGGFSLPMLLTHDLNASSSKFTVRNDANEYNYTFLGGMHIKASEDIMIRPSFLLKILPSASTQVDINAVAEYKNVFGLGACYRTNDAVVGMAQFRLNDQFILGYSFDFTLSELKAFNTGSHEIFLRYDFKYKVKAKDPRFFF